MGQEPQEVEGVGVGWHTVTAEIEEDGKVYETFNGPYPSFSKAASIVEQFTEILSEDGPTIHNVTIKRYGPPLTKPGEGGDE